MTIDRFDSTNMKEVRKRLEDKLKELTKEIGISFTIGNISYNAAQFSTKITGVMGSKWEELEEHNFKRYAEMYGLKPEYYDATFKIKDHSYTIKRIDTKKRTYPVICLDENGTSYKFSTEVIKFYMGLGNK